MFGKRSDGKELKNIPGVFKLMPMLMKTRNDSQIYYKQEITLSSLEDYMEQKKNEGIKVSYMDIIYAAIVRTISQRPQLNRFVINGRTYKRNTISVCITIKKELTDEGEETTVKNYFTGKENIFEVAEILQNSLKTNKDQDNSNVTDDEVDFLTKIPTGFLKFVVNILLFLDKHGLLTKKLIKLSPFHTSAFLTNVGSIGIDAIYHHIYNFGTTSLFFAMGRKKKSYIYEDDEIKKEKCITIAFVGDERICDGYYYANSFKLLQKLLNHPELLEENCEVKEDID